MRGAHPERDVEVAIERSGAIRRNDRVLIACSGGPDSVALVGALSAVAARMNLSLALAFVNHALRASAWQDECVVLSIAARFELPLEVLALEEGGADEQRLRAERYESLGGAAKRRSANVVATGHHAEDQSETVMLALLRGTGPAGLRGMRRRRRLAPHVDLARPLVGVPSEALRAYCHARALPYAVDPTNARDDLRRNAVRAALAALRPLFPGLDAAVARAAHVVGDEGDATKRAELRRTIRERLAIDDELRDIDFTHVEAAVRALETGRSGTFLMKPGVALRIEGGAIAGILKA